MSTAESSGRQQDQRFDKLKHAVDGYAHDAEWKQENPHDRIGDKRNKGKRP